MDIFEFREKLIEDYSSFVKSFIQVRDPRISSVLNRALEGGLLWPSPLIQMNPAFQPGGEIEEWVAKGVLHPECSRIFRRDKKEGSDGKPLRLFRHQVEAIESAQSGNDYVLTTGTGSGKSLAYIVPIVDYVLKQGSGKGIRAIIIYPMNALANSQYGELEKFLRLGFPPGKEPVTFARYTGQEDQATRERITHHPPDILLTNYVMMELILTRVLEKKLIDSARSLKFLVLDELHTYRGRQGADVALLIRRLKDRLNVSHLQCIGTSATLASEGAYEQRQREIARVASKFFGAEIKPEHVIGETLQRVTTQRDFSDPVEKERLSKRIFSTEVPQSEESFIDDSLSSWIESTFGITAEPKSERLTRSQPRSITGTNGAAKELSRLTGARESDCIRAIQQGLLMGYKVKDPRTGFPLFAFRLHQFISQGDTVYASLESEEKRHISLHGQRFVPGDRERILLPLVFCRECGQEYYCVSLKKKAGHAVFVPRELSDRAENDESSPGFLYIGHANPWPTDPEEIATRVPPDWLDEKGNIRKERRNWLPERTRVDTQGNVDKGETIGHFIEAPFRFCLVCGVSYGSRQMSDFPKLSSLGTEGRSTATTVLSLSAICTLKNERKIKKEARKLLSFTDNRQDAALQAGHFNDFTEIGILRSALYRATSKAGKEGIGHEKLTQKVLEALDFPLEIYASNPEARFLALEQTKQAFRQVLGYRLYRDLKRGWRIMMPNLEQCGLLEIAYLSLGDLCRERREWGNCHRALESLPDDQKIEIAKTLLDYMRRELAIKVDFLDPDTQNQIRQQSGQHLVSPWAIDENEPMERFTVLYPRPRKGEEPRENLFLSARGGFGQYLRAVLGRHLKGEEIQEIIQGLLETLRIAGLVERVVEPKGVEGFGYRLPAAAMVWLPGDGTKTFHDPIRIPSRASEGGKPNRFFVDFYKTVAGDIGGIVAKEHTAQVQADVRLEREKEFREARLPILYCSPTMELGVDIAELNVVGLRNIPPTPANYAQRSGRAGRQGQPALVFSYSAMGNSHDQYFFKQPHLMVAGAVKLPCIDLTNEDLIRAHVHAIWLTESQADLKSSLKDILGVEGNPPGLEIQEEMKSALLSLQTRENARKSALRVLETIRRDLEKTNWYHENWLEEVLKQLLKRFDDACERWRNLYKSACSQAKVQSEIILDASRREEDKKRAKLLRGEAESQIYLLLATENQIQADFYSYRYFASEGFLPGYNFPRLPLSAYIPGRRSKTGRDEFLSRPRFLAISEFGPRAIVYHEGSKYIIHKTNLPVSDALNTKRAKLCPKCGYLHPIETGEGPDRCERCDERLVTPLTQLLRLQNVGTKRSYKISSDEEERFRLGYELKTGVRFESRGEKASHFMAQVVDEGNVLAQLVYGQAATLWRINLGWNRRKNKDQQGFILDTERGYWARNESQSEEEDPSDPISEARKRVVPYVEDHRNVLLWTMAGNPGIEFMATLQAALRGGIRSVYQLEEAELAVEPLPGPEERNIVLFYESAEGGAGVLRNLVEERTALAAIAKEALRMCHFDVATEEGASPCEAACYACLMSYFNQGDHRMLDRHLVEDFLRRLARAEVKISPTGISREKQWKELSAKTDSELERKWLGVVYENELKLPSRAQVFLEEARTRVDFLYDRPPVSIYIDGPDHDSSLRRKTDEEQEESLENLGYRVVRFRYDEDWKAIFAGHRDIFGG